MTFPRSRLAHENHARGGFKLCQKLIDTINDLLLIFIFDSEIAERFFCKARGDIGPLQAVPNFLLPLFKFKGMPLRLFAFRAKANLPFVFSFAVVRRLQRQIVLGTTVRKHLVDNLCLRNRFQYGILLGHSCFLSLGVCCLF